MSNKSILLVEDNPSDIELTTRAFHKSRISNPLIVVQDGQEAIDYLLGRGEHQNRDVADHPAVVLLDLNLPKVNGLGVLQAVRADPRTRRIPVVILTTSTEEQDMAQSYDLGVNSYIRKPVSFDQFASAISQLGLYWLVLNQMPPKVQK